MRLQSAPRGGEEIDTSPQNRLDFPQ
jgi:hypothetical protein